MRPEQQHGRIELEAADAGAGSQRGQFVLFHAKAGINFILRRGSLPHRVKKHLVKLDVPRGRIKGGVIGSLNLWLGRYPRACASDRDWLACTSCFRNGVDQLGQSKNPLTGAWL